MQAGRVQNTPFAAPGQFEARGADRRLPVEQGPKYIHIARQIRARHEDQHDTIVPNSFAKIAIAQIGLCHSIAVDTEIHDIQCELQIFELSGPGDFLGHAAAVGIRVTEGEDANTAGRDLDWCLVAIPSTKGVGLPPTGEGLSGLAGGMPEFGIQARNAPEIATR
jgi:hypothetical protein